MKILYIDFTNSLPTKSVKSHGGGNYTKTFLYDLKNYMLNNKLQVEVIILYPNEFTAETKIENEILGFTGFKAEYINTPLYNYPFEKNSVLFLPLLGVKKFSVLKKLKKNHQIEIVLTVHGLRLLDMKWDRYDLNYLSDIKEKIMYLIKNRFFLFARKTIYKHHLKHYIPYCDKLVTVSNYSLSFISKYTKMKKVYLQYENIIPAGIDNTSEKPKEPYILFVSGNRSEKNLARTLDAYRFVYNDDKNILPLFITGTNKKVQTNLVRSLDLSDLINSKKIVFFDYVSDEQLANLYNGAAFLLYTSKSEGFGLPALEAAKRHCPVVAAYGTSIPEVLGSNALYIDPYSIRSIADGIKKMSRSDIRESYVKKTEQTIPFIENRINESNAGLFEFIVS